MPQVLKSCTEFIEKHGVVDGIYRLSGIASNIQKLRYETHTCTHTASLLTVFYVSVYQVCTLHRHLQGKRKNSFTNFLLKSMKTCTLSGMNACVKDKKTQTFKDLVIGPVIFVFAMLSCDVCMCNAVYT